jgi:hypothetical protein
VILANTPAAAPKAVFQPYLGDFARMVAVGREFYGVFAAANVPDPANFPSGIAFQRNRSASAPFQLLGNDGSTVVAPSIDPFFFSAITLVRPALRHLVPDTGPEAGGTPVTITGVGFTGATEVLFGTGAAGALVVVSDTELTVTSPPGTGQVEVTVTGPGGTSAPNSDIGVFHYTPSQSPPPPVQPPVQPPPVQPPPVQPPVTPPPVQPPPVQPPPVQPPPPFQPPPLPSPPLVSPPSAPVQPPAPVAPPAPAPTPAPAPVPQPVPIGPPPTMPAGPQPCANRCGTCSCCQSAALVAHVANVANAAIVAITAIAESARRH